MSETPEERRERLLAAIRVALGTSDIERRVDGIALAALDAFLEALEAPVASMVYGFRMPDLPPLPATGRKFRTPQREVARQLGFPWYRPAIMMSETPEERRERLLATIQVVLRSSDIQGFPAERMAQAVLHVLLEALEPPLADMVRQGVEERARSVSRPDDGSVRPSGFIWYHPAPITKPSSGVA